VTSGVTGTSGSELRSFLREWAKTAAISGRWEQNRSNPFLDRRADPRNENLVQWMERKEK
jgi:hypothetical protein